MADFAELGLEAVDHLIDNHFDDIPDQVFHPRQALHSIRHRDKNKGSKFPVLDRLEGRQVQTPRPKSKDRSAGQPQRSESREHSDVDSDYSDGVYSVRGRDAGSAPGPRTDPYYREAQHRSNDFYVPPSDPPERDPRYPARNRDPRAAEYERGPPTGPYTWSTNPSYIQPSQTPYPGNYQAAIYPPQRTYSPPRRTRSQNQQRRRRSRDRDQRPKHNRRPSSTGPVSTAPSQGLTDAFSTSDKGLGAGGLGALAGGFVAQQIERKTGKGDPMLLTLLGAAVGGIGANVLEGRMERKKARERERERDGGRGRMDSGKRK